MNDSETLAIQLLQEFRKATEHVCDIQYRMKKFIESLPSDHESSAVLVEVDRVANIYLDCWLRIKMDRDTP